MQRSATSALGAALLLLAGCAQPASPPAAAPPMRVGAATPMPAMTGGIDGTYTGPLSNAQSKGRAPCIVSNGLRIRLNQGVATSHWRGPLQGTVGTDGAVSLTGTGETISGRLSGGTITGSLETPACHYDFSVTKS